VAVLLTEIDAAAKSSNREEKSSTGISKLARLFPVQIPDILKTYRDRGSRFASGSNADLRQNAWLALALTDGSFDGVWATAAKQSSSLADLLNGIPLLTDQDFRAKAYDKVKPLVENRQADSQVRRAAIRAVVSMNHEQEAVFNGLTALINRG